MMRLENALATVSVVMMASGGFTPVVGFGVSQRRR
jgi:hypothetical protein